MDALAKQSRQKWSFMKRTQQLKAKKYKRKELKNPKNSKNRKRIIKEGSKANTKATKCCYHVLTYSLMKA